MLVIIFFILFFLYKNIAALYSSDIISLFIWVFSQLRKATEKLNLLIHRTYGFLLLFLCLCLSFFLWKMRIKLKIFLICFGAVIGRFIFYPFIIKFVEPLCILAESEIIVDYPLYRKLIIRSNFCSYFCLLIHVITSFLFHAGQWKKLFPFNDFHHLCRSYDIFFHRKMLYIARNQICILGFSSLHDNFIKNDVFRIRDVFIE